MYSIVGARPGPHSRLCPKTQTLAAHEHWHIDVSYVNIGGTFYSCAASWTV
jgi:hypothetical protein